MALRLLLPLASLAVAALGLASCVPNRAYRTTVGVCGTPDCTTGSIEIHPEHTVPPSEYRLAYVEFDDQGDKYLPGQLDTLVAQLEDESKTQDLSLVVFVHGWRHNAGPDDDNVQKFHDLLHTLALTESEHPHAAFDRPRKVFGIYAGWRGEVLSERTAPLLTFYDRKAAAQRVAVGSIRELLGRVRAVRDTLDRTAIDRTTTKARLLPAGVAPGPGETLRSTRLLTIGHSFGGLIVYEALAQYFVDRAAAASMASSLADSSEPDHLIPGYGDLVVLVNPAVEATSWEPIRQIAATTRRTDYAPNQHPVLVSVTSKADDATGIAFPLGRWFEIFTWSFVSGAERQEAERTAGHYPPFWTHLLSTAEHVTSPEEAATEQKRLDALSPLELDAELRRRRDIECAAHNTFETSARGDDSYLKPHWTRDFSAGARLTQTSDVFDPNDPFWMITATADVIPDHNDINRPVFVDFIRQLYDDLLIDKVGCKRD